eukprot:scaffold115_cov304-Prasinococcus_capsulatus_cf.AAC.40
MPMPAPRRGRTQPARDALGTASPAPAGAMRMLAHLRMPPPPLPPPGGLQQPSSRPTIVAWLWVSGWRQSQGARARVRAVIQRPCPHFGRSGCCQQLAGRPELIMRKAGPEAGCRSSSAPAGGGVHVGVELRNLLPDGGAQLQKGAAATIRFR